LPFSFRFVHVRFLSITKKNKNHSK
jgi:hypothetical protein